MGTGDVEDLAEEEAPEIPPPQARAVTAYFPWLVKLHALAMICGPTGFLVLMVIAGALWYRRQLVLDAQIIALAAAGLACALGSVFYRRWFERWCLSDGPDNQST